MSLAEHLAEFRSRLLKALSAIIIASIAGWFASEYVLNWLFSLVTEQAASRGMEEVAPNYSDVTSPFYQRLRMSLYLGTLASSPIWLYQLWAFVVPGLTKKERRRAMGFAFVAAPLFVAGVALALVVLPKAFDFLIAFVPDGAVNFFDASAYLSMVTRLTLAFGFAFLTPVFMVALNMAGILSSATMFKAWRPAVFGIFLFAAIASPSPDITPMVALAVPMCGLYFAAVGISWILDRRRGSKAPAEWVDEDDDSASDVAAAQPIAEPSPVPAAQALETSDSGDATSETP